MKECGRTAARRGGNRKNSQMMAQGRETQYWAANQGKQRWASSRIGGKKRCVNYQRSELNGVEKAYLVNQRRKKRLSRGVTLRPEKQRQTKIGRIKLPRKKTGRKPWGKGPASSGRSEGVPQTRKKLKEAESRSPKPFQKKKTPRTEAAGVRCLQHGIPG